MTLNVIVLVRNEEELIGLALDSLNKQSLLPHKVIVVDDDSTDSTPKIIERKKRSNYVVVKHKRKPNDTFHSYHRVLRLASQYLDDDADFIGILDADVYLEKHYYQKVLDYINRHPNVGLCGGIIYGEDMNPRFIGLPFSKYVLGANRVFTKKCWYKLNDGKILSSKYTLAVDTHLYLEAILHGFEPQLSMSAESWSLRERPPARLFFRGYASYMLGYSFWYMLLRAIRNMSPKMLAGYFKAKVDGVNQLECKPYVQKSHVNRIKGLLHLIPPQDEIPYDAVRKYVNAMVQYRKTLSHSRR